MTSGYEPFLIEITESDAPSTDAQITAVEATDAGWFCTADGWTVLVPSLPIKRYGSQVLREAIVPAVGDRLRLYGSLGHQVEGIQVNDDVVYYRDTAMREASRRRWLEDHDAQQRREFVLLQARAICTRSDAVSGETEFAAGLAEFQAQMPHVGRGQTADTGSYSYSYADLTAISEAALPLLTKLGFSWITAPTTSERGFVLRYALKLTPREVGDLAALLRQCTEASRATGCYFGAFSNTDVRVGDSTLSVRWDEESRQYVVDDRNGD